MDNLQSSLLICHNLTVNQIILTSKPQHLVVGENNAKLKTTLIILVATFKKDLCQKSVIILDRECHNIWYHSFFKVNFSVDVLELSTDL